MIHTRMTRDKDSRGGGAAGAKLLEDGLLDSGMGVGAARVPGWARWVGIGSVCLIVAIYVFESVVYWVDLLEGPPALQLRNVVIMVLWLVVLTYGNYRYYREATLGWYLVVGLIVFEAAFPLGVAFSNVLLDEPITLTWPLNPTALWYTLLSVATGWLPLLFLLRRPVRTAYNVGSTGVFWVLAIGWAVRLLATAAFYV